MYFVRAGFIKGYLQEAQFRSAKHFAEVAHQLHGYLSNGLLSLIYLIWSTLCSDRNTKSSWNHLLLHTGMQLHWSASASSIPALRQNNQHWRVFKIILTSTRNVKIVYFGLQNSWIMTPRGFSKIIIKIVYYMLFIVP